MGSEADHQVLTVASLNAQTLSNDWHNDHSIWPSWGRQLEGTGERNNMLAIRVFTMRLLLGDLFQDFDLEDVVI